MTPFELGVTGLEHRAGHLLHEQRHAVGLARDLRDPARVQRGLGDAAHERAGVLGREPVERQHLHVAARGERILRAACRADEHQRRLARVVQQAQDELERGGIGPVQIFDDEHQRRLLRLVAHPAQDRVERQFAATVRAQCLGRAAGYRDAQQAREQLEPQLAEVLTPPDHALERTQALGVVSGDVTALAQLVDERVQRRSAAVLPALEDAASTGRRRG